MSGAADPLHLSPGHSSSQRASSDRTSSHSESSRNTRNEDLSKPSPANALQALLAFSALHEQVRWRKALAARHNGFEAAPPREFEKDEQFVLDEVLKLIAERAVAITGADGMAIALAENNEIVLRAAAGTVRPDVGARIDRESAFSGASFRNAQVVMCDDTETDARVNLHACRRLGARSMIAVPLCGRRRVIGLLEAFSSWPFGFNDSDVRNLTLLAELVVGALRPEDEDRFADSAEIASAGLAPVTRAAEKELAPVIPATPPISIETATLSLTSLPVPTIVVHPPAPRAASTAAVAPKPPIAERPLEVETRPEAIAEILDKFRVGAKAGVKKEIDKAPIVAAAASEITSLPEFAAEELQAGRSTRPGVLVSLVCLVVAVAFAAGIWYKLKTSQLGGAMVTQKLVAEKTDKSTTAQDTTGSLQPSLGTLPANPGAEISDTGEPSNTPASAQELAKFPRVTGIRHWSSATSSTVVLDLEDQVQYEAHRLASPERIYFDLRDTQLSVEAAKSADVAGDPLLNRVRVAQPVAGMTRVVLETRTDSNFSVSLEPNPYRLVIEIRKVGVNAKGTVNLFPNTQVEKSRLAIVVPPPTKEDLQLRAHVAKLRIVVDAGHGGWDLGTVGRRGLLEKDLVLEIAQRLGRLLESRLGADVVYTRKDDNYIPLDDRAGIANQAQADLFVSVHANYSDLPSARGVETYYTNTFSAPGSKEGAAIGADANTSAAKPAATLSPADLHERIEQSRKLAASVQRSLYGTLVVQNPGLRDRGIKEAGFVVLTESAMPGILAEVSFVSSPTDEQKLRSDGYREQIAEALYKGIARYAAGSKGVKVASLAK
jgi:N-acetylmuramoyl-L-alanine amidase/putative methionine-R-sulfoxide reductase with GAF domain